MLKEKIKKKDGAISVLMVGFILTLSLIFSGLVDISMTSWGLKEIQNKIDIAGINALYMSIDDRALREDMLGIGSEMMDDSGNMVDKSKYAPMVRDMYRSELSQVKYAGVDPNIEYVDVDFKLTDYGLGYNTAYDTSAKARPQVILESVVSYRVASSTFTDRVLGSSTRTIQSSSQNTEYSVSVTSVNEDGERELLIHSITRLVLK